MYKIVNIKRNLPLAVMVMKQSNRKAARSKRLFGDIAIILLNSWSVFGMNVLCVTMHLHKTWPSCPLFIVMEIKYLPIRGYTHSRQGKILLRFRF